MTAGKYSGIPLAFLCFFLYSASTVQAAPPAWKAGAAAIAITPERPLLLEGYVPAKIASGKIHDVYVKALALQDPEGGRAVIVTADLSGYDYGFTAGIAKEIERKHGLSRERVLFNASHTHSGPAIYPGELQLLCGYPPEEVKKVDEYISWARERFIRVIGEAISGMRPAIVSFSSASPAPFAMSRRYPTEKGIVYRSTPGGQYAGGTRDDTVPVLKAAAPDGAMIAVLFGYACHPITLSGDKFCGDYPGFAQQYLQEMYPGAVAMFMQGCGGQLVPNARFQVEYAMGHGRTIADAVKKALDGTQTQVTGPLRCAYAEPPLEFEAAPDRAALAEQAKSKDVILSLKAQYLLDKLNRNGKIDTTIPCPLQAIRFGKELLMVGISGETAAEYAVTVKTENQSQFTWVAGYCNYVYAYLPTWQILREGGYEGRDAIRYSPFPGPFKEDVETRVLPGVREVVKRVGIQ